jgi:hypothetical protein
MKVYNLADLSLLIEIYNAGRENKKPQQVVYLCEDPELFVSLLNEYQKKWREQESDPDMKYYPATKVACNDHAPLGRIGCVNFFIPLPGA